MFKHFSALLLFLFIVYNSSAQEQTKIVSLSLKEAIDIAIKNHPEIQKSKYRIDAAHGRNLREISLSPLSISYSNEFIPNGMPLSFADERSLEISQEFEFPTAYFARNSRAEAEISAAYSGFEKALNYVRTLVKRNYYTALSKLQILKIAEENYNIASEFYKKAEIRYKVGEGSNLELLTSKVQLSEARSFIENSKKEYNTVLNELNYSMQLSSEIDLTNVQFSDSLYYKPLKISLEELKLKSLDINPVIRQAAYELESSRISRQLAYMNLLPTFNAAYMFQSRPGITGNYGFSFGVSLPVWFMFDQRGQIKEASAYYEMNNYELQNIKNTIIKKINSDYIDFENDEKQLLLYKNELLPQAEEIFLTANLSYQAGEISYLEFLQAKFTIINVRINLIKQLFDYEEAIINLEESTGMNLE